MYFTIDTDLNVTAHDAKPADQEGSICFSTLAEFDAATTNWPLTVFSDVWNDLVDAATTNWPLTGFSDVWNDLAGTPGFFEVRKVKRFENRQKALKRLFAAIQEGLHAGAATAIELLESSCATDEPAATIAAEEDMATKKKTKKKAAARAAKPKAKAAGAAVNGSFELPTKKETIISLVSRKKGATITEIMDATGWQKHSVRGFIATLNTKGGFSISSEKNAAGERVYQGSAA